MPFWQQNKEQVWPRNGTAPTKDAYPSSLPSYGPGGIPLAMDNPGTTQPSDGFSAWPPNQTVVNVTFGRHDGLNGRLMEVAQADTYDSARGPFPRAGTWEEPGGPIAAAGIGLRLSPSTSAHPGLAQATGPGPVMIFTAPPVFSVQTKPIYALGL
jgi:hypothetical protein